eukprot:1193558-Pleurochrysis_carterae.AAC.1
MQARARTQRAVQLWRTRGREVWTRMGAPSARTLANTACVAACTQRHARAGRNKRVKTHANTRVAVLACEVS